MLPEYHVLFVYVLSPEVDVGFVVPFTLYIVTVVVGAVLSNFTSTSFESLQLLALSQTLYLICDVPSAVGCRIRHDFSLPETIA